MEKFFKNIKNKAVMGGAALGILSTPLAASSQEAHSNHGDSLAIKNLENTNAIIGEIDSVLNGPAEFMDTGYKIAIEKLIASGGATIENWNKIKIISSKSNTVKELAVQALVNPDAKKQLDKVNEGFALFLAELYKEKSPFAELPGDLHFKLTPGYDLSINNDDGRKTLNLVLNKNFNYQSIDEGGMTELDQKGLVTFADSELQFKNDHGSVYVHFVIENTETNVLYVQVKNNNGKVASYHFNNFEPKDASADSSYDEIKELFLSVFQK